MGSKTTTCMCSLPIKKKKNVVGLSAKTEVLCFCSFFFFCLNWCDLLIFHVLLELCGLFYNLYMVIAIFVFIQSTWGSRNKVLFFFLIIRNKVLFPCFVKDFCLAISWICIKCWYHGDWKDTWMKPMF